MPKFSVYGSVVGSKYLGDFEADTKEEAIEKASLSDAGTIFLCHQCSDECESPEIVEMTAELAP